MRQKSCSGQDIERSGDRDGLIPLNLRGAVEESQAFTQQQKCNRRILAPAFLCIRRESAGETKGEFRLTASESQLPIELAKLFARHSSHIRVIAPLIDIPDQPPFRKLANCRVGNLRHQSLSELSSMNDGKRAIIEVRYSRWL